MKYIKPYKKLLESYDLYLEKIKDISEILLSKADLILYLTQNQVYCVNFIYADGVMYHYFNLINKNTNQLNSLYRLMSNVNISNDLLSQNELIQKLDRLIDNNSSRTNYKLIDYLAQDCDLIKDINIPLYDLDDISMFISIFEDDMEYIAKFNRVVLSTKYHYSYRLEKDVNLDEFLIDLERFKDLTKDRDFDITYVNSSDGGFRIRIDQDV